MEKELRNGVNRRVNCDTANLTKVVDAAQDQIAAIRRAGGAGRLEQLPEKLRAHRRLRLEHPEATLSELAEMMDPPVTKSALNHRMRKLIERPNRERSPAWDLSIYMCTRNTASWTAPAAFPG